MILYEELKILPSDNNIYYTNHSLICDVCKKNKESVFALKKDLNSKELYIACIGKCFDELFENFCFKYNNEYFLAIELINKTFNTKKIYTKRTRAEMTLKKRFQIFKRDNFCCVKCGRRPPETTLYIDHIIPVSKFGTNSDINLQTLCFECNMGKGVE